MNAARWMMGVAAAALAAGQAQADLVVSNKPTSDVTCSNGTCTATAADAVLNAGDLTNLLAAGDTKVKAGGGATNIVVKAPLSWTSTSRLTFDANQSVEIDQPVSVTGSGAVTIATNDGGAAGDLMFDGKGNITFWDTASNLIINGKSYTLVTDIATLASDIAGNPSGFYALANDYDASQEGTYSSAPIATTFGGTFEGLGHVISNLQIVSSGPAALFQSATGALRDLKLLKVSISGGANAASLLVQGDAVQIAGCYATGIVMATSAGSAIGGLVAKSRFSDDDGTIVRSHAHVSVRGESGSLAGGLVGFSAFKISLSSASGDVKGGANSSAGGLIGAQGDTADSVLQSFATGAVSGGSNSNVGGLAGIGSDIQDSYAIGATTGAGTAIVGGLAGQSASGTMGASYSTGKVKGGSLHQTFGGLLGEWNASTHLIWDYWDIETTGRGKRNGCGGRPCGRAAKGLTTEQFKSGLPNGFDPSIWGENEKINDGYPYLLANKPG